MATLTLAQYAQLEKQPLLKGVMLGIAQESIVGDILNWRSTDALSETGTRYDEVITPDWIPLDGAISSKTANGKPLSYGVYEMAVHIDIPEALENTNSTQLERSSVQQTNLAIKGAAYVLNDTFVNGSQAVDANQFDGINRLLVDMDASQTVTPAAQIDLTGTYTDAVAESLFSLLDQAIYACEGHMPTCGFANDTLLLKLESYSRQYKMRGNDFNWMEYSFDVGDTRKSLRTAATRPAFRYRGIPIFDIGKKADQTTRVITNQYTEGGGANSTRLFFCKAGEDDLEGLQLSPLNIRDIGILEGKNVIRKRVTWRVGLASWGPRSLVKATGIKAGTVG